MIKYRVIPKVPKKDREQTQEGTDPFDEIVENLRILRQRTITNRWYRMYIVCIIMQFLSMVVVGLAGSHYNDVYTVLYIIFTFFVLAAMLSIYQSSKSVDKWGKMVFMGLMPAPFTLVVGCTTGMTISYYFIY